MPDRRRSLTFLLIATTAGMLLWFMTAAVIPDMAAEAGRTTDDLAWLSSAVPLGFGIGAMVFALLGIPDRFDPRGVFAACALGAALANLALLAVPIGGGTAVTLRFATGFLMAGTWPVSMKIALGWTLTGRGTLLGVLAAALTAGQAGPYLLAWLAGTDWRSAVMIGSAVTTLGAAAIAMAGLGPHHARATAFRTRAILVAWTDRRIRAAILGYLGHMWEFIAFWAWAGVAAAAAFSAHLPPDRAVSLGKFAAFACILAAVPVCALAGPVADRLGKARVAATALTLSGTAAVLTAVTFGGPIWLTFALIVLWGAFVVADSPQFSALVAQFAPPELAGSLVTFQASLGFTMTAFTTQSAPLVADRIGWPGLMLILALGPAFGLWAMRPAARAEQDGFRAARGSV